jgi:hypothetical protein
MTDTRKSQSTNLSEKPPAEMRATAQNTRPDDIRGIVEKNEVFPPHLLSLTEGGAATRVNHLIWVIRYHLAYPDSGLEAFRSRQGRRTKSCKWAAWETDTSLSQIQQEITTVYASTEHPQKAFENDLEAFVDIFEEYQSHC